MKKHLLLVMTNAEPGQDDEYNDWYTNVHLKDVVKLDGFETAQRFIQEAPHPADAAPLPYRYLAIYEVPEDKLADAKASLGGSTIERGEAIAAGRTPQVPISPAMQDDRIAFWFTQITEKEEAQH
jgi:hypothetical protein